MPVPKIGRRSTENFEELESQALAKGTVVEDEDSRGVAADLLIAYLPESTQEMIAEAAKALALPRWQMLLGYVMRVYDRSEMFAPYIMASWEAGGKPNTQRPCSSCQRLFLSRFPDALYCCPPCYFGKLNEQGHADDCPSVAG